MYLFRFVGDFINEFFQLRAIGNGEGAIAVREQHVPVAGELAQPPDGLNGGRFAQILDANGVVFQPLIHLEQIFGVFGQLAFALLGGIVFHVFFMQKIAPHQFVGQLEF